MLPASPNHRCKARFNLGRPGPDHRPLQTPSLLLARNAIRLALLLLKQLGLFLGDFSVDHSAPGRLVSMQGGLYVVFTVSLLFQRARHVFRGKRNVGTYGIARLVFISVVYLPLSL